MSSFANKTILLIVGGGIAAYKSLDLVRKLRDRGGRVVPVVTEAAKQFVTPLSMATLAGSPVRDALFSLTEEAAIGHIELSRSADIVVVAPATANILAKMAQGHADDLASTLLLATDKRTLVVPAMNVRMWRHPSTQRNMAQLQADGVLVCGPAEGAMACGEFGPGRMSEPAAIVQAIEAALSSDAPPAREPEAGRLKGRRVVVTSGPTHEPIDPVRFIANRSSGKQGHAIAAAAVAAGAHVVLVSGPVDLADPPGVASSIAVETASQMLAAVEAALPADIFVGCAAVADWRVAAPADHKLKKEDTAPTLMLVENPDVLATVAKRIDRPALVVGFAAETAAPVDNALVKLKRKGCDIIVCNDVGPGSGTFGGDTNAVVIVDEGGVTPWPRLPKSEVATRLVALMADRLAR